MTLSDAMLRYRAKKRISQKELAEKCGVSIQTIYAIENNLQTPSKVTETKIRLVVEEEK